MPLRLLLASLCAAVALADFWKTLMPGKYSLTFGSVACPVEVRVDRHPHFMAQGIDCTPSSIDMDVFQRTKTRGNQLTDKLKGKEGAGLEDMSAVFGDFQVARFAANIKCKSKSGTDFEGVSGEYLNFFMPRESTVVNFTDVFSWPMPPEHSEHGSEHGGGHGDESHGSGDSHGHSDGHGDAHGSDSHVNKTHGAVGHGSGNHTHETQGNHTHGAHGNQTRGAYGNHTHSAYGNHTGGMHDSVHNKTAHRSNHTGPVHIGEHKPNGTSHGAHGKEHEKSSSSHVGHDHAHKDNKTSHDAHAHGHKDGGDKHHEDKGHENVHHVEAAATDARPVGLRRGDTIQLQAGRPMLAVGRNCMYIETSSAECLPADGVVEVEGRGAQRIDNVRTGERLAGAGGYSTAFMWTHRDGAAWATFIHATTSHGALSVTPGHYVYANGQAVAARQLRVGDALRRGDGSAARVEQIDLVRKRGLYNPQTHSGDVVVDGFVVSTYTEAVAPDAAHALLAPLRMLGGLWTRWRTEAVTVGA